MTKLRVDGIRRDYANKAKARWYAQQRAIRFAARQRRVVP